MLINIKISSITSSIRRHFHTLLQKQESKMDDASIDNKVKDSCNAEKETTSNINEENEAIVNPTAEKKKNKSKSRKKKNKSKFYAENETADNANPESERADARMKQTSNDTSENKIAEISKAEQKVNDAGNAKIETDDNNDSIQEIPNKTDSEQELKSNDDEDPENIDEANLIADYEDYRNQITEHFVYNFQLYLQRCYDIFIWRSSDIEKKSIDLPWPCHVLLRGSFGRYISSNFYNTFYPYVRLENPAEALEKAFRKTLLVKAHSATNAEFLMFAALIFLTSFDLKSLGVFKNAPKSAFLALVNSILHSKQRDFMPIWYPQKDWMI